ncbi:MAG TPA: cytochrome c-type biogenesis protein CcmH [Acidimicrobiia bacterium]|nr:cytochrome c-type biogenesis protein CcmH [Acidimicrobiia bacterium]
MSERLRSLAFAGLLVVMGGLLAVLIATSPSEVDRVEAIGERIKCPVCQGESIANSPAQMARDMMSLVAERVEAGAGDEEIVDELLASYSGAVLLDPPASGATLILWLAPVFALVTGAVVIWYWRRRPPPLEGPGTPAGAAVPRRLVPLIILGLAFAGTVVAAVLFVQEDTGGPVSGVAALGAQDLDDVSNETMEAVIAANADHPQVDGMRLALAERYFQAADFSAAFPHYLAVAESEHANRNQVVTALIRLGTMAWEGNGEVETAIGLFDQALAVDPQSSTARYLKGRVLWCGADDPEAAEDLFAQVVTDPGLAEDPRSLVEEDLAAVRAGESCV